jgi:hypothetical protein
VGALSTSVFGLDFLPAAIAIVLGTVISACLIGLLSTRGAQTGLVQLIQTRAPFGWFGNLPAAAARLPRLRPRSARRGQHLHQHLPCATATYWSGIGRVVYALGEDQLLAITGANDENPTMSLPCRAVFVAGQRPVEVAGPFLAGRAVAVHDDF